MNSTSPSAQLAVFLRMAGTPGPHLGRMAQGQAVHAHHLPPTQGRQKAYRYIHSVWSS